MKYAERFNRKKHISGVLYWIAILLFEELCTLGNYCVVPNKMLVIFCFISLSQVQLHNYNMTGPPAKSWDLEISNSLRETSECCLILYFSACKLLYYILPHAKLISYNQKKTQLEGMSFVNILKAKFLFCRW